MQRINYLLWRYAFRSDNLIASVCNKKVLGTLLVSYYFLIYDCWQFGVLNNRHRVYKTVGWTVTKRIFICIKFCIWLVHRILSWIFHAIYFVLIKIVYFPIPDSSFELLGFKKITVPLYCFGPMIRDSSNWSGILYKIQWDLGIQLNKS